VLALGMLTHALRPWKRFSTHLTVLSADVLAGSTPVFYQFAGTHDCCRTALAPTTSLWMVAIVRQRLASRAGSVLKLKPKPRLSVKTEPKPKPRF